MGRFWRALFTRQPDPIEAGAPLPAQLQPFPTNDRASNRAGFDHNSSSIRASTMLQEYELPEGWSQEVVGESHYQAALLDLTGRRVAKSWEDGIAVRASLVPEPENPYDRNAVVITVSGRPVGYLPRAEAAKYQPSLLKLWHRGQLGSCAGTIVGGGAKSYGIWLRIAEPDILGVFLAAPEHVHPVSGSNEVIVIGEERHQETLQEVGGPGRYLATLHPSTVAKGKYAGSPTAEVQLAGRRVGALTYQMGARYQGLLDRTASGGMVLGCIAETVREEARGLQVRLMLPSPRELADIGP